MHSPEESRALHKLKFRFGAIRNNYPSIACLDASEMRREQHEACYRPFDLKLRFFLYELPSLSSQAGKLCLRSSIERTRESVVVSKFATNVKFVDLS